MVDLRAVPQQHLGHLLVAVVGGGHQRRIADAVLRVRLRAPLQQNLDQLLVTVSGGDQQERPATRTAMHARRINQPVPSEPRLHHARLAVRRRCLDLFRQRERRSLWRR